MPANLPPDYYAAERRYREAQEPREKIKILREMLSIMPKHKGTEHLQGDLKRKIAKLSSQSKKKSATSRSSGLDHIPREGAGQVVLVGPPNSGKSSILSHLTHAHSEVADYPYSTFKPIQGMMPFEDIQIQLIDLPPVSIQYTESWLYNIVRLADLVLLVVDLSSNTLEEDILEILSLLEEHKIVLKAQGESRPQGSTAFKSTLIIGTKADLPSADKHGEILISAFNREFPIVFISIQNETNIFYFKEEVFKKLHIIRVYTKIPQKKADLNHPFILPVGTTVMDAASVIHKDLATTMTYARLWGSDKYDGQRIERDHVLGDKDILEIHTR
jgi:ribosome-interacting GTPase 1